MLIKDLSVELDTQALSAVHGGGVFSLVGSFQGASAEGIGNTALNTGPTVTNVDASTDVNLQNKLNQIIGSVGAAAFQL
jgi:hypothetical protein